MMGRARPEPTGPSRESFPSACAPIYNHTHHSHDLGQIGSSLCAWCHCGKGIRKGGHPARDLVDAHEPRPLPKGQGSCPALTPMTPRWTRYTLVAVAHVVRWADAAGAAPDVSHPLSAHGIAADPDHATAPTGA